MSRFSEALSPYAGGFLESDGLFLEYIRLEKSGLSARRTWTRSEFWDLARKAASVLRRNRLGKGDRFLCGFGENRFEDLAFRLASTMTGAVPVTVNWQADGPDQAAYKVRVTDCRLILHDDSFNPKLREALQALFPEIPRFEAESLESEEPLPEGEFCPDLGLSDDRIVIFTSGTTGNPKGVRLSYANYENNASALGGQLLGLKPGSPAMVLVVNPLHHTNSSAVTDCFFRHAAGHVTMLSRYGTAYWQILAGAAESGPADGPRFAFAVARHFDFLEQLAASGDLPVSEDRLKRAMGRFEFVIGSAPVGPMTVQRLLKWSGRVPMVRFGSTESTFQVSGIPASTTQEARLRAFEQGWNATFQPGYYIGRPHPPHTELKVVRGIDSAGSDFMAECGEGSPGYLISRGGHIMKGTVQEEGRSSSAVHDGWYVGFRDIGFYLRDAQDGQRNFYWVERDSALLIRGGANTACDAVGVELGRFLEKRYGLSSGDVDLAVVGLRLESEHEDACCVTLELKTQAATELKAELERTFIQEARDSVSKGARPDRLRFGPVPRTFKGSVRVGELKKAWMEEQRSEG
ncbi:MAG: AMP-binding protein [Synergistales bacterium]|jgi:acyl-CoA synthetase (AMP-forming)/AMP-acid ligase II